MSEIVSRDIIGTAVSITDYEGVLDRIDAAVDERERIFICCTPASSLVFARRDRDLRNALGTATVVTPDGMGVVWAARLLGESIRDRVYGPDLMLAQFARAERAGQGMYLFGGFNDDALAQLRAALEARFPKLRIVGAESPPHKPQTTEEEAATVSAINSSGADVVWVGLGSPKQEVWMKRMRDRLEAPVLCGVGAAFDFHAGRVSQAPSWMQSSGLEWLFRLSRDPLRLGRRYLMTLPHFVLLVALQRLRRN